MVFSPSFPAFKTHLTSSLGYYTYSFHCFISVDIVNGVVKQTNVSNASNGVPSSSARTLARF